MSKMRKLVALAMSLVSVLLASWLDVEEANGTIAMLFGAFAAGNGLEHLANSRREPKPLEGAVPVSRPLVAGESISTEPGTIDDPEAYEEAKREGRITESPADA